VKNGIVRDFQNPFFIPYLSMPPSSWLALMIGSSRLHWAWFAAGKLQATWDLPHLSKEMMSEETIATLTRSLNFESIAFISPFLTTPDPATLSLIASHLPPPGLPLWIASVVPSQTQLWQAYSSAQVLTLEQIPLQRLYPTIGIDRALALWGAGDRYGFPALVIDAGTALTFTGADREGGLCGGAILPGLQLQMRSLYEHTAALPPLSTHDLPTLPLRWATSTPEAIQSGILYTLMAGLRDFIDDWLQSFPQSAIALTGGDSQLLMACLTQRFPELVAKIVLDPQLIFWGMQAAIETTRHQS
jgi:type III pantothenate kinase